jgi:hypothetical protein
MQRIKRSILLVILLSGCSLFEPTVEKFYFPEPKVKRIVREQYSIADTLVISSFLFDSGYGKFINRLEEYPVDTLQIIDHYLRSQSKQIKNLTYPQNLEVLSFSEAEYYDIRTKFIVPKMKKLGYDRDRYHLIPYYSLIVFYDANKKAGWGGYPVPTSDNLYRVVQILDTYVIHDDSIYYSNSFFHSDTLIQENDVPFKFEFQPEVLDSLISLTMHEFRQRLR